MRRFLTTAAIVACAALAAGGCGGDDSSGGALESSLSYVPRDTPFAIAIDTDLEGDQYQSLDTILGKFPGGDAIKDLLVRELEEGTGGVSFKDDVRPLLGNPFVISATTVSSFLGDSGDDGFVAAIQVDDSDALDALIDKTNPDERGEVAGATVYEDDGTFFALEDDRVVLAGSEAQLEDALRRADGDDHLDEEAFERSLERLPEEALARVYVNLQVLIEQDPDTAPARRVGWVAALQTLGLTASADDNSIDVEFNLRADGGELSDDELPLAAGDEAPEVVELPGDVAVGVRDPGQIVRFFETALQAVDPRGFGDYQQGKQALATQLDLDVDEDIVEQLSGDLAVSVGLDGGFSARAEPRDAEAFADTVAKLAEALPQIGAGLGVTRVVRRGDFFEARLSGGGAFVFGMSDGAFVVASDAARARRIASQRPSPVDGASGSLVVSADAERLGAQLVEQLGPALGLPPQLPSGLFTRPLDELRGSVASSTDGMTGEFSLTLD